MLTLPLNLRVGLVRLLDLKNNNFFINLQFYNEGNITSGLPSIQAPSFNIEYGNQTFNFMEICQNLGSALFVTPLIAILESMAIAKSFGKILRSLFAIYYIKQPIYVFFPYSKRSADRC